MSLKSSVSNWPITSTLLKHNNACYNRKLNAKKTYGREYYKRLLIVIKYIIVKYTVIISK